MISKVFIFFIFLIPPFTNSMPPNEIQFIKQAPVYSSTNNYQQLQQLDLEKIPIFGNLPKPILRTIFILYLKDDTEQIIRVLKASAKLDKTYRLQRCQLIFSTPLCLNASANPFYLWAKLTVDKFFKKPQS